VGEEGGQVLADTPCYQAVIGHAGVGATSNLELELETPFAAVQVASLDGAPIAQAERLLLVTGARVANTGMRWLDDSRQSLGDDWGTAPTRIEPVTGMLSLVDLDGAKCVLLQALDGQGQPMGEPRPFVRERAGSGTRFIVPLTGDPPTLWYSVHVER
jgi:hypothetical protein